MFERLTLAQETYQRNRKLRQQRLRDAKLKGDHTKDEWVELVNNFDCRCVRCGDSSRPLHKDHIVPLYQGGSNGLDNIQPLCDRCNLGKASDSFNWAEYRRQHGWESTSK
jgi:5-methylcytosine-specific restriction endonuclease McrA